MDILTYIVLIENPCWSRNPFLFRLSCQNSALLCAIMKTNRATIFRQVFLSEAARTLNGKMAPLATLDKQPGALPSAGQTRLVPVLER